MAERIYHIPVLIDEVLTYLDPQPGGVYVDATFGGGGHTRAILEREPQCRVIGLDWDAIAIEKNEPALKVEFGDRVQVLWGNFAQLSLLLKKNGIKTINGVLADFGTSQDQLKGRAGFSFATDTPLDMRMSPAHQKMTATYVVNKLSERELRQLLWDYGQEVHAGAIARAIVQARTGRSIRTTGALVDVIESAIGRYGSRKAIHPATQTFQALRIYVNNELENIHSLLAAAVQVIAPGGRIVCISFHSLEDRVVKHFFVQHKSELDILTSRVVMATEQEILKNPSSRSARLRAAMVR